MLLTLELHVFHPAYSRYNNITQRGAPLGPKLLAGALYTTCLGNKKHPLAVHLPPEQNLVSVDISTPCRSISILSRTLGSIKERFAKKAAFWAPSAEAPAVAEFEG